MARGVRPQTPVATLLSAVGAFPRPFKGRFKGRSPRAVFMGRPSVRGAAQRACGVGDRGWGTVCHVVRGALPIIVAAGDSGF